MQSKRKANDILKKMSDRINQKETKWINKKESNAIKDKIAPLTDKISGYIPDQMNELFQKSFESAFLFIFEKGTPWIEKSYQTEKAITKFEINQFILEKSFTKKNLKRFEKQAERSIFKNQAFSTIEGGVLGLLGIGLPDIPLFLSMILKSIYEIALSYGFSYENNVEQMYIMSVLCASLTQGEEKRMFAKQCDLIGAYIDENIQYLSYNIEAMIKVTSKKLANTVVLSKFIQGLPVIGVSGGASNYVLLRRITKMANLKYRKRFINLTQRAYE